LDGDTSRPRPPASPRSTADRGPLPLSATAAPVEVPCEAGAFGPAAAGAARDDDGTDRRWDMGTITTVYKGDDGFEALIGDHHVVVDASDAMGGKGRGPTSSELFLASLSSCVTVFVADYCRRTDLDASGLTVDVSYVRTEDPVSMTDIEVTINLPNAEVGDRLEAIRRVAEHCPVHETVEYSLKSVVFDVVDKVKMAASTESG
jgi:uncharacterized OsmC-like protein